MKWSQVMFSSQLEVENSSPSSVCMFPLNVSFLVNCHWNKCLQIHNLCCLAATVGRVFMYGLEFTKPICINKIIYLGVSFCVTSAWDNWPWQNDWWIGLSCSSQAMTCALLQLKKNYPPDQHSCHISCHFTFITQSLDSNLHAFLIYTCVFFPKTQEV